MSNDIELSTDSAQPMERLLARYVAGDVNAGERLRIEAWAASGEANAALLRELTRAWEMSAEQPNEWNVGRAWGQVQSKARMSDKRSDRAVGALGRWRYGLPIAAVMFAAMMAIVMVPGKKHTRVHDAASLLHQYKTGVGERATITLVDGSRVTLAPQSQLEIAPSFNRAAREVRLSGEAFFDAAPGDHAPFIVRTGSITTRVLGTSFGVRRYADDKNTRIAVVSGKVVSGGARSRLVIPAGAVGRVNDSSAVLTADDAKALTHWVDGTLVFENASVQSVLETLGKWYGYRFQVNDTMLISRRVTVAFAVDDRAQTMALIKKFFDVTMTFSDSVVTIRARGDVESPTRAPKNLLPLREVGK